MDQRDFKKRSDYRRRNHEQIFPLILGQCSQALRNRMEADENWNDIDSNNNVMELLQLIQRCMTQRQTRQYPVHTLHDAEACVFTFRQKTLANNVYYEKFKDLVETAECLGSEIGLHSDRVHALLQDIAADPDVLTVAKVEDAQARAKDRYLAVMFLLNSDKKRYGSLVRDIENEYTRGTNTYPNTLSAAYAFLVNYRTDRPNNPMEADEGGLAFYNSDEEGSNRNPRGGCDGRGGRGRGGRGGNQGQGGRGRGAEEIPPAGRMHRQEEQDDDEGNDEDAQFLLDKLDQVEEYSCSFHIIDNIDLPHTKCPNFIAYTAKDGRQLVLDSASTLNLITDEALLHGIHRVNRTMPVRCNAGVTSTNLMGWLGDYPEPVWFNPKGVANILSLFLVKTYYRIQYDSTTEDTFMVTKTDGMSIRFRPTGKGLYTYDGHVNEKNELEWAFINTVAER
jgi:hypothetical protein